MADEMKYRPDQKREGFWLSLPAVLWLVIFFVAPLLIVLSVSFLYPTRGGFGGRLGDPARNETPLTFQHYLTVFGYQYRFDSATGQEVLAWRYEGNFELLMTSLRIALISTFFCLLIGYPLGFFIATRKNPLAKQLALFLVVLPFWTNFLVRTYAWRLILGNNDGLMNAFLLNTGIVSEPLTLLFTQGAVVVGMVYGFLPFMVLPIYASVERFDFHYVEASHDLGGNDLVTFFRVILPMTLPGVVAGCILVFIPSIGTYVTSDMLGGTDGLMIGRIIYDAFRGSGGNWPLGGAFSAIMMLLVFGALLLYARFSSSDDKEVKKS
jgi:spermidine/putrescine transport system permease protein